VCKSACNPSVTSYAITVLLPIAVPSMLQENSAVWIGDFDFDKMDFVGNGAYYHFPRNDHCDQIYCNVEVQYAPPKRSQNPSSSSFAARTILDGWWQMVKSWICDAGCGVD
jgi:hypothetical protein